MTGKPATPDVPDSQFAVPRTAINNPSPKTEIIPVYLVKVWNVSSSFGTDRLVRSPCFFAASLILLAYKIQAVKFNCFFEYFGLIKRPSNKIPTVAELTDRDAGKRKPADRVEGG